jgi:DNA-binding CsgD family transcriptional regulator
MDVTNKSTRALAEHIASIPGLAVPPPGANRNGNLTKAQQVILCCEREQHVIQRRRAGASLDEIARSLRISRQRASYIFHRAMQRQLKSYAADTNALRKLELDRLQRIWWQNWRLMEAEGADPEQISQASDRLLRIQERRAKLTGLNKLLPLATPGKETDAIFLPVIKGATAEELVAFSALIATIQQRKAAAKLAVAQAEIQPILLQAPGANDLDCKDAAGPALSDDSHAATCHRGYEQPGVPSP